MIENIRIFYSTFSALLGFEASVLLASISGCLLMFVGLRKKRAVVLYSLAVLLNALFWPIALSYF
ncbi:hypothetical protein [Vibrio sonorensis]|uniref:hypothetical protein n=1 Tax=Vibrio sonorensis TaxID=1004316 RepID=UPI0011136AE1|nr:hypothetical protein [Vibrio sonorensis]